MNDMVWQSNGQLLRSSSTSLYYLLNDHLYYIFYLDDVSVDGEYPLVFYSCTPIPSFIFLDEKDVVVYP